MRVPLSFLLIFLLLGVAVQSDTSDPVHDPSLWDSLLKKYVREDGELDGISLNVVNYTGFAQDKEFDNWIKSLESAKIDNLSRDEIYAFYTNVYNSLAINMIAKHPCKEDLFGKCGPIAGIRDLGTVIPWVQVWDQPAGIVGGKQWSLQQVENFLLAPPKMEPDPRVHSAIVCASVSCPNIRKGAFTYQEIDNQYNQSFNNWLFNTKKGMSVDTAGKKLTLSKIFDWYSDMFANYFKDGKGSVQKFIMVYLWTNHTNYEWLSQNAESTSIQYFEYNWNANTDGSLPCDSTRPICYPLWALLTTIGALILVTLVVVIVVVCVKRRHKRQAAYHRISLY